MLAPLIQVTLLRSLPKFSNCSSLASLNLSGWDTTSVTDMGWSSMAAIQYPSSPLAEEPSCKSFPHPM
ncbi:MAG: hypothetical protein IJI68_13775 [Eggerthellaceae bacterium]|nr:hypothetical protein [Eggerthellaceae bacterium]